MSRPVLSKDEVREVRRMIADGTKWEEIADAFGISTSAVHYHARAAGLTLTERAATAPPKPPTAIVLLPFDQLPWSDDALCAQADPDAWYPEKGGSTREAKRVCMTCTVQTECLDYALTHEERFGIWGGLSERERRNLTRPPKEPTRTSPTPPNQEEAIA